jgi:predicted transcriptional regulator
VERGGVIIPTYTTSYFFDLMQTRPFWSTLDIAKAAGCHKDTAVKYLLLLESDGLVKRYKAKTGGITGFIYIWVLK